MAIYHLHMDNVSRSEGRSVVKAAAYRRAERLYDERLQETHDYTAKCDVVHSELSIPQHAPVWVKDLVQLHTTNKKAAAEKLWNAVEKIEKRKDSRLAKEIEFALPIELTQEQNITLAHEFLQDQVAGRGMIADWSVHYDEGNPHIHALLTTRQLTPEGFGQKVRGWNDKALLINLREQWTEYANYHLLMHQHDVRIDHRSYEKQGIDLKPSHHVGKAVTDMERRGIQTERLQEANVIHRENLARIAARPEIIVDKLTKQSSTFTQQQLGQELGRYANDQGKFSVHTSGVAQAALKNVDSLAAEISQQPVLTPDLIAKILAGIEQHEAVFSERILAKAIEPFTNHAEQFAKALLEVKVCPEVIYLGAGEDGRDRFTTRQMFAIENDIQQAADKLRNQRPRKHAPRTVERILKIYEKQTQKILTAEQRAAVKHLTQPVGITCLVGRAGTGKSFSLGAAKAVWEAQGLQVRGVALAGIAATGLAKDSGIESRTIASLLFALNEGKLQLTKKDVIVMDEAGMTDSVSMHAVLTAIQKAGARLALIGDHQQLQPVGPGAAFRALLERIGFSEIQRVYRQQVEWQSEATRFLAAGKIKEAIALYAQPPDGTASCIHFSKDAVSAMDNLIADWASWHYENPAKLAELIIIAFERDAVKQLNDKARAVRVQRGELAEGYKVNAAERTLRIAQGDRLVFLKNKKSLGIENGRFATVTAVNFTETGHVLDFSVQLDGKPERIVKINPADYQHFDYGYAATGHKLQGATRDNSLVYAAGKGKNAGFSGDRHSAYVQLSRHRQRCHVYADEATHTDLGGLTRNLSRHGIKDSVLDFPLAFAQRRGIAVNETAAVKTLAQRLRGFTHQLADRIDQALDPVGHARSQLARAAISMSQELSWTAIEARRKAARAVAAYVDANRQVGMDWQALQGKLLTLGLEEMSYEPQAFAVISATTEYKAMQQALIKRDAAAAVIIEKPDRYTQALEIYQLDSAKLQQQAQKHTYREQVKTYQILCQQGKTVLRDRLAAAIQTQLKNYYPHLKSSEIDLPPLKDHAVAHARRVAFCQLTPIERQGFELVEQYRIASQFVGVGFSQQKQQTPTENQRLVAALAERGRLASLLLQNPHTAEKALNFYQIGVAVPHFNQPPRAQDHKFAEARWYKLQQAATQHEITKRVQDWRQAVSVNDLPARLRLAHQIRRDTKLHHGAIVRLGGQTQEIWYALCADAKRYERNENYQKLDRVERLGFQKVEAYVEAKRANAIAWKELFASRAALALDDKTFYAHLAGYAKNYSAERNQLAAKILANPTLHQAGLDYFSIKIEELDKQAYAHQCQQNVERYQAETHPFQRSQYALQITQDPKAHHGLLIENNLNWRDLYRSAHAAEQQQHFAQLTPEEKALQRLAARYHTANRTAGQRFGQFKEQSQIKAPTTKAAQRIDRLFAQRDYLAHRLLQQAQIAMPEPTALAEWTNAQRLKLEKLQQQHNKHQEKIHSLQNWQQAQKTALISARAAMAAPDNVVAIKRAQNDLRQAQLLHQALRFEKSPTGWQYALHSVGLLSKALQVKDTLDRLRANLAKLVLPIQSPSVKTDAVAENQIPLQKSAKPAYRSKPKTERIHLAQLSEALKIRARDIALHYLGAPKKQESKALYYGANKGSLTITLSGKYAGKWKDWATGEGGDMLNLIQYALGTSNLKEAIHEARHFLGESSLYQTKIPDQIALAAQAAAEEQQRAQRLAEILRNAQPVAGTLAERYLREMRGIQGELNPHTFQFHPQLKNWKTHSVLPALLVLARDAEQKVIGLQAIFLTAEGKKAHLGDFTKLSRGTIGGGALVHQGKPDGVIALAEGPETALSVAEAQPDWNVYTTYGVANFTSVALKTGASHIVLCADNDGVGSGTEKAVQKAVQQLTEKEIYVEVVMPDKPAEQKKWDYNDALQQESAAQLKKQIDGSLKRDYPTGYIQKAYASFRKTVAAEKHLSKEEQLRRATERIIKGSVEKNTVSKEIEAGFEQELE